MLWEAGQLVLGRIRAGLMLKRKDTGCKQAVAPPLRPRSGESRAIKPEADTSLNRCRSPASGKSAAVVMPEGLTGLVRTRSTR